MSARHRQAKKKLRQLREYRATLLELSDAYALVRADVAGWNHVGELGEFHNGIRDSIDDANREIAAWEMPPR